MEISVSSNSITINGNIKSVSNFQEIKSSLDSLTMQNKNISINITDSLSITSSVIGYFNKLILKDKIAIEMNVGNDQLFELLTELNLVSIFKARKV
ncbi:MAG: hypothetical protein U9P72_10335 [Campylobacterota bacterium]|nr:hypothetical protein [Campylobacterota bacterium]